MRSWAGWGLRLLGVLLLPAACAAHGAVVVWLYQAGSDAISLTTPALTVLLLILLGLIVFSVLLVVAVMLGATAAGLWVWDHDVDSASGVLAASMLLALGGLAVGYVGTLVGVDSWALRWWGAETTCTVRYLETAGGQATQDGIAPATHFYALECAATDAPDRMRTGSFVEPGSEIPVMYDPHGHAGAQPKSQVDGGRAWAWGTGIAMAVWTVLTLAKVCRELLVRQRVPPSPRSAAG